MVRDPEAHQEQFHAFLAGELEAVIRHETGEALEPSLKAAFPAVLERFPQTRVELFVRTLKDALADVNEWGRLAYIIAGREPAFPGGDAGLAPGAHCRRCCRSCRRPFRTFWPPADWGVMEAARQQALDRLRETAAGLNALLDWQEAASDLAPGRNQTLLPGAVGAVRVDQTKDKGLLCFFGKRIAVKMVTLAIKN